MKKNLFMVAAVALMAMVSCNKIENNNGGEEVVVPTIPFEFTAYASETSVPSPETQQPAMAQKVDTKATLVTVEGKPKTHWEATDKINVNGFEFVVDTESEYGAGARFVGKVDENFGTEYKAVYPSSAGKTWDAITVKSNQTAQADTFDPDALVAVAYSNTDNVLAFKHVTSLLKFQVPAACQTVTISSDNDLAGTIKITNVVNDDPSTQDNESNVTIDVTTSQKTLTVTCEGGFKTGTDYYVAVLPGEKSNFVVRIDGYISTNKDKVNIKRSTIANMKELPAAVIRLYIKSEYTHFDMNIYAWGIDGVSLPSSWPGKPMNWDGNRSMYYYDFPYEIKDKKMNYIVNNGGAYQTSDLEATISNPEYEDINNVNWHWIYFKPSNNWKESSAWFAAWFNDGGEYWMRPTGPDKNGVYGFVQPSKLKKVEFERMNSASDKMEWSNKWNSTANQTIPTDGNNYFKCTEGWWNNHNDSWTKYDFPN